MVVAFLPVCFGQTTKDLAELSLEELLNMKVTSAARKPQSLRTTAAAVFVITSEDIRRSGIRLMPELLRLAPGVQVSRLDAGNWAISIRGFSTDFSNKLLVLVDGQSIYNEEYGGVFWDTEQMPVEDIDRIEIVRGPGAAMWGNNAVHGVINIITKSSANTLGGMISGEAGIAGTPSGVARYGAQIGSDATYRVTGYYTGERRAASSGNGLLPAGGFNSKSLSLRVDWAPTARDTVFVTGRANRADDSRVVFDLSPANPTPAQRYGQEVTNQGQLTASWRRTLSDKSSLEVRFSFDHMNRGELLVPLDFNVEELGMEHHWNPVPRHDLVWGFTYRNSNYHLGSTPSISFPEPQWDLDSYSAFAADEITLVHDRLQLIAGVHAGHNSFTGMEYQPTVRLAWTPTPNLTTWAAVSRAVRTPSILNRGGDFTVAIAPVAPMLNGVFRLLGNPEFKSEPMISYELGQRVKIGKNLSLDGAAFLNSYQREGHGVALAPVFIPPQSGTPGYLDSPTQFQNAPDGHVFGAEVSAVWSATHRWRLNGGYSWLRQRVFWHPWNTAAKDPSQQFQIRSQLDLPRNFELDMTAYFYGTTLPGGVGRYLRGDARLGWRPNENAEFEMGIRDALDPQHPELISLRYLQAYQVRRNAYLGFSWHF
jgi:iron complex outermembrane receptor protein